jgi:DNA primase
VKRAMSVSAFSHELIERARSVDILSVAAHYGARLRKAGGGEFAGSCPLCGGTDRFAVNVRKNIWNCRGCGKGGDVIELVRHLSGCDLTEAIERLTGENWPVPQFAAAPPQRQRAQASPHRAAVRSPERTRLLLVSRLRPRAGRRAGHFPAKQER